MILNGNQRGGSKNLALHLMKAENECVNIHELRGFMSQELMGAFNELYAISRGTRCKQFMYSLSLNPPRNKQVSIKDFETAINRAEKQLNLQDQPRAIVFHEKHGRRHCHVVWSRIDLKTMKAVQISYDREKLTTLSRELFLQHGWDMPVGLKNKADRDPKNFTHAQHQQAQRTGKDARQIKTEIQESWAISDSKGSFEHALAEHGYFLARGDRRGFVVIDMNGEVYSVPKQAGVKTKDVRAKLGDENKLPSVADILALLEQQHKNEPKKQTYNKGDTLALVSRYHAAFTPKMMERTLKSVITDVNIRQATIDKILQSDEVIKIDTQDGQDVYATQEMIDLEHRMMDTAQDMAQTASHKVNENTVYRAIFNLNKKLAKETGSKTSLSEEQINTLHHMTSDKQLSLVVGVAGAGKTTIMKAAKKALEAQGYRVRGAAPSGIAAAGLRDIGMNASTLHSLEARIRFSHEMMEKNEGKPLTSKQRDFIQSTMLTDKDVLIVDEAGMVSSKQLANIIELSKQSGAKLILVGDPAQLQSIEAGAAFRTLLKHNNSAALTEVHRQKTDWQRNATMQLSQGNIAEALHAYEQNGCIEFSKNRQAAKTQLVTEMMESYCTTPEQSRLVLAYTRKDVADLNSMIKAEMVKTGKVSAENTEISISVKDGDGYTQEIQDFSVGDRIMFRENNRDLDVMNGSFGTLQNIKNGQFHITLDNGKSVTFSPKEYNSFQLGYAATVHKSQGMTVDETYVLATPHFDRHTSYVALSRHKQQVKLYANTRDFKDHEALQQSLEKQGEKLSTLDFSNAQKKQQPQRQSKLRTKLLDQQDFVKLRDGFLQQTEVKPRKSLDKTHYPARTYEPER